MATSCANEQSIILHRYLINWNYLSVHLHLSPTPLTSTYESEAHGSHSAIDHILCPSHCLSSFRSCFILEEDPSNTSDHLPILAEILVSLPSTLQTTQKETQLPSSSQLEETNLGEGEVSLYNTIRSCSLKPSSHHPRGV